MIHQSHLDITSSLDRPTTVQIMRLLTGLTWQIYVKKDEKARLRVEESCLPQAIEFLKSRGRTLGDHFMFTETRVASTKCDLEVSLVLISVSISDDIYVVHVADKGPSQLFVYALVDVNTSD